TQTAAEAEVANFARQPLQCLPVTFALSRPQCDPQPLATFRVDYLYITVQTLTVEFASAENLHCAHVHIGGCEYTERLLHGVDHRQEIRQHENLAGPPNRNHFARQRRRQVDLSCGYQRAQLTRYLDDTMTPIKECRLWRRTSATEHTDHHAVAC